MLKKLFFCVSVAAMAAGLSSCSSDIEAPATGEDGTVVFTAKMPGTVNSRAYSDGSGARQLSYAVYEANTDNVIYSSDQADAPQATYNNDLTFTLALKLVKGQNYDFIFWADNQECSAYTFDPASKSVSISYEGIESNDETRDAFFTAEKDMLVTGAMQKNIQLYRPFAQLNIGTDDIDVAERAGTVLGKTQVVVKDVYSELNLFSGEASKPTDVTYAYAALPENEKFPVNGYDYLSMNYILTGEQILDDNVNSAQKETRDITIAIQDADGKDVNSFNVSAVPFQRNYRTNIYGSLLTSTVDFVIEIVPDYNDPDKNMETVDVPAGKVKFNDNVYESIPAAIATATADDAEATIYVGEGEYDTETELIVPANNPITRLTIAGIGDKTVLIKNKGYNVKSNIDLTFKDLTIKTNASNYNGFYHSGSEIYESCRIDNALFLYGTTALFKDCRFNVDTDKLASTYNVWCYGAKTATFEDCIFNAAKSILIYCENNAMNQTVNVKNCVFNGSELKDGKAAIEVDCHRLGADYNYTINLDNNKASGYDGGNLSGRQLWNVKDGEQFTIYENGVKVIQGLTTPDRTGTLYHVNNAEGLQMIATLVNNGYYKDGELKQETFQGKTIAMTADIDMAGIEYEPIGHDNTKCFKGTFDGQGNTVSNLTMVNPVYENIGFIGRLSNGTVRNVKMSNITINNAKTHYGTAALVGSIYPSGLVTDCEIDGANISGNRRIGGITGYTYGNVTNCKVNKAIIAANPEIADNGEYDNGDKAGGITGMLCESNYTFTGNIATNCTISAFRDLGGVVGHAASPVKDCTCEDSELSYIQAPGTMVDNAKNGNIGEIIGRYATSVENCTGNSSIRVTINQ